MLIKREAKRGSLFLPVAFRRLVVSQMFQSLALSVSGVVDCAIVGRFLGVESLASLQLSMPVFTVINLFTMVLTSGMSVQMSRAVAQGDREQLQQIFRWTCACAAGISLALMLIGFFFRETVTELFTGTEIEAAVRDQAADYLQMILLGSFPVLFYTMISSVTAFSCDEKRLSLSAGVIFAADAAGDLLAVVLHGGIRGFAMASVFAYVFACLVLSGPLLTKSGGGLVCLGKLRRRKGVLRDVILSGMPMAVRFACIFICPLIVNRLAIRYGTVAGLAALSIQDSLHYLPVALCKGISSTTLLLTGIYAAEADERALQQVRRIVLHYSLLYVSLLAALFWLVSPVILPLFTGDEALRRLGVSAFRWYLLGTPFAAINLTAAAYLQGKRRGVLSGLFTVLNQLLLPVLAIWLLGDLFGIQGLYAGFSVHELALALGLAACIWIGRTGRRKTLPATEPGNTPEAELLRLITTPAEVTAVSEEIYRLCLADGVDKKQSNRIALCMEELGINSFSHGFTDGKEHHLEVRFVLEQERMTLSLRDNGRPFDPKERYKLLDPEDPTAGIGLRLVFAAAEEVRYSHALDLNMVCILLPLQRG